MNIVVYVDKREQKVLGDLRTTFDMPPIFGDAPELVERVLDAGDYIICQGDVVLAVIERKTLADYGASLKDGRISNLDKLLKLREVSGCQIYYLIEGKIRPGMDSLHSGIEWYKILASIRDTQIMHNVMILQTSCIEHTCSEIRFLAERYGSRKVSDERMRLVGGLTEAMNKIKPTKEQEDIEQLLVVWANVISTSAKVKVANLSTVKASEFARRWSLRQWIKGEMCEDDLRAVRINDRGIGERLIGMMKVPMNRDCQYRLLAAIKRVSVDVATAVAKQVDLRDDGIDLVTLVVRPQKNNTKLGKMLAGRINMLLDMKIA